MSSTKPVYELIDDGRNVHLLFARGNFSVEDFCDGAHDVYGGIFVAPGDVYQAYARWVPVWGDDWDDKTGHIFRDFQGHYLDYPVEQKRGAFLITYAIEFSYHDEAVV